MLQWQKWLERLKHDGIGRYLNAKIVILGIIGIALLLIGSLPKAETPTSSGPGSQSVQLLPVSQTMSYEDALENKLIQLLSGIKGAGQVHVNITFDSGNTHEYVKNTVRENKVVQEKDNGGGVRTTTETKETETLALTKEGQSGSDHPVVTRETHPVVKGVVVVADGAGDAQIRYHLWRATQSALAIPAHKVTILARRK